MVPGAGKAAREEQDRGAPAGVEAAEQGLPLEVGQAGSAVGMGAPTCCAAFADRSSRRRCIRTPRAVKGSKGQWSFASGSPTMDRSRPWRSSALLDSESWTRPRSRRSAAPPRIPSSGAGSGCPSPTVWISRSRDHVMARQFDLRQGGTFALCATAGIPLFLGSPLPIIDAGMDGSSLKSIPPCRYLSHE